MQIFIFRNMLTSIVKQECYGIIIEKDLWIMEQNINAPLQKNSDDCGIFTLIFALFIARKQDYNFGAKNINFYRRKILADLCEHCSG